MDHGNQNGEPEGRKPGQGHHRVDGKDQDEDRDHMVRRPARGGHMGREEDCRGQREDNEEAQGEGERVLLEDRELAHEEHDEQEEQRCQHDGNLGRGCDRVLKITEKNI